MSTTTKRRTTPSSTTSKSSTSTSKSSTPKPIAPLSDLDVASLFETTTAIIVAISLVYGAAAGLFILMLSDPNVETIEALPSLMWITILGFQMGYVLAPNQLSPSNARLFTYFNCIALLCLPHLNVCKRGLGKATGASQGAASILTVTRAFQLLHRIEENNPLWVASWGRWRRFYQGCGLSWHDLDYGQATALNNQKERSQHTSSLLQQLIQIIVLMVVPCFIIGQLPAPSSIFSTLMLLRCAFMAAAMICAFNVFDLTYRWLMSATNGIAVGSIMKGDFWSAETVSEIWLGWNLPVQRLLGNSVYLPLRKKGVPRSVAKLIVFLVSGLGHIYPCYVAGLSYTQISFMMLFFVAQVVLIMIESVLGIRSRIWSIGIEICLSPLFVMPVLFFTDPALIGMV